MNITKNTVKKDYYGNILYIRYHNDNKVSHRKDGPAKIHYDNNGEIISERWRFNGHFYTFEVEKWLERNNFNSWKEMNEDDFNRMWFEIL